MHPVTRIYWMHGYGKFRQPKRMRKENTGRILLMHGTDAWLAEFAHYTHTCLARRKQLVSRKNLHGNMT